MAEALETNPPGTPAVPVVVNVAATAVSDPARIRKLLVDQITSMVRWRESVLYMRDQDVDNFVEVGASKVLTTMLKRIDKDLTGRAISTPDDIENFLKSM